MKRPGGITFVSILSWLNGLLIIGFAVFFLSSDDVGNDQWIGIAEIVIGLLYFVSGYGLWKLKNWGLGLALLLQIFSIALSIYDIHPGFIGGLLILSYLAFSPTVKKAFSSN